MDFEKFLNENKEKIWKFEVYQNSVIIHIEDNGVIEIDTNSPMIPLHIAHVVNE